MRDHDETKDADWRVRVLAAERLGTAQDQASLGALILLLSDANTAVVEAAAESLVQRGARSAFLPLLRALDLTEGEGEQVASVFARHRGSWLEQAAVDVLEDTGADLGDRAAAAEVLGYPLLAEAARPALVAALGADSTVAGAAREALARLDRWAGPS